MPGPAGACHGLANRSDPCCLECSLGLGYGFQCFVFVVQQLCVGQLLGTGRIVTLHANLRVGSGGSPRQAGALRGINDLCVLEFRSLCQPVSVAAPARFWKPHGHVRFARDSAACLRSGAFGDPFGQKPPSSTATFSLAHQAKKQPPHARKAGHSPDPVIDHHLMPVAHTQKQRIPRHELFRRAVAICGHGRPRIPRYSFDVKEGAAPGILRLVGIRLWVTGPGIGQIPNASSKRSVRILRLLRQPIAFETSGTFGLQPCGSTPSLEQVFMAYPRRHAGKQEP